MLGQSLAVFGLDVRKKIRTRTRANPRMVSSASRRSDREKEGRTVIGEAGTAIPPVRVAWCPGQVRAGRVPMMDARSMVRKCGQ